MKVGRGYKRNLDAGPLAAMVASFDLHLRAERSRPRPSVPTWKPRYGSPPGTCSRPG